MLTVLELLQTFVMIFITLPKCAKKMCQEKLKLVSDTYL